MKRMTSSLLAALFVTVAICARADNRKYVWTYEYMTMPEGAAEVEYYLTLKVPEADEREISSWQHQVEVEYGLTPRWDIALYQVWQEDRTADESEFGYSGFKARTRYRIAERNALPVDVLLYAEYERESDLTEPDIGELKLVLSKELGSFDVNYNQIMERSLSRSGETEHKYASGFGYAVLSGVHLGVESTGNYSDAAYTLGPTIALSQGRIFLTVGALFGLNEAAPDFQARMILGIGL
jgi:hypothetical protein